MSIHDHSFEQQQLLQPFLYVTEQASVVMDDEQQFEQFQKARVLYRRMQQSLFGVLFLIPQQRSNFFSSSNFPKCYI
jgi:hypothetical protein